MKSTRYADVPNSRNGFSNLSKVSGTIEPTLMPQVKSIWQYLKHYFLVMIGLKG